MADDDVDEVEDVELDGDDEGEDIDDEDLDVDDLDEEFEEADDLVEADVDTDAEEDDEVVPVVAGAAASEESDEEDDEEEDPDDVEADLDAILKDRLVVAEDDDEDEEEEPVDAEDKADGGKVRPKAPGEFVCQSCFLVKHPSQMADAKNKLCRDCV